MGAISSLCEASKAHGEEDFYDSVTQDKLVIRKLSSKTRQLHELTRICEGNQGKTSTTPNPLTIDDFSFVKVMMGKMTFVKQLGDWSRILWEGLLGSEEKGEKILCFEMFQKRRHSIEKYAWKSPQ